MQGLIMWFALHSCFIGLNLGLFISQRLQVPGSLRTECGLSSYWRSTSINECQEYYFKFVFLKHLILRSPCNHLHVPSLFVFSCLSILYSFSVQSSYHSPHFVWLINSGKYVTPVEKVNMSLFFHKFRAIYVKLYWECMSSMSSGNATGVWTGFWILHWAVFPWGAVYDRGFLVASKADEALISLAGVHLDSLALWWVEDKAGKSSPWASARASSCLHLGCMEFIQSLPGQGVQ